MKQLLILHAMIFACMAVCGAIYFIPSTIYCEQRKNPPTAPIYPGSTLTDTSYFLVGLDYSLWPVYVGEPGASLATYEYTAPASPEQIIEFYGGIRDGAYHIMGAAEPFGEYNVGIPSQIDDGTTDYFIEIRWERCQ